MTSADPHAPARPMVLRITIAEILDAGLVRAVYQPIVELATGTVVAYEALARGPVGTPFESPMAMLNAASDAGRLAELDWACRAAAVQGALDAGLGRDVSLFVNFEPDTIGHPCPDHLRETMARGERELTLVSEFTERAIARDPAGLLAAAQDVRAAGWGVALDDVGADRSSLALLPFLGPDVIKLDLRLVQSRNDADVAGIANGVRAHAERTGAVILAEGIETPEHARVAEVLGATLGQGWLFGRPGELPATVPRPSTPVARAERVTWDGEATPFQVVTRLRGTTVASKRNLMPMSRHLEEQALAGGDPVVLLASFQDAQFFTPHTRMRYTALGASTALTAALAVDLDPGMAGVRTAALSANDPIAAEWNVIVVGPFFAAALVARDRGDGGPDRERTFDFVITHDRALVIRAAQSALSRVAVGMA